MTYKWEKVIDSAEFSPRDGAGIFVHNDSLYLAAGFMFNDVWRLTK